MTLTLELPEDLAERVTTAYPEEAERNQWILCSLAETIEAEQQDRVEVSEIVNAELDVIDAGEEGYTLREMRQHWDELRTEVRRKLAK